MVDELVVVNDVVASLVVVVAAVVVVDVVEVVVVDGVNMSPVRNVSFRSPEKIPIKLEPTNILLRP